MGFSRGGGTGSALASGVWEGSEESLTVRAEGCSVGSFAENGSGFPRAGEIAACAYSGAAIM